MVRSMSLVMIICILCGVGFAWAAQDKKQFEIDEKEYLHNVSIKRTPESWEALAHFYDRTKQYRKVLKVTEKIRKDFPRYTVNIAAIHNKALGFVDEKFQKDIPLIAEPVVQEKVAEPEIPEAPKKGCYTKKGFIYSLSERVYDTAMQMAYDDDTAALAKMALAGQIGLTRKGIKVFKKHTGGFLTSKTRFRLPGETRYYWTSIDAVTCNR